MKDESLRHHLIELLEGGSAHLPPQSILKGIPPAVRGIQPENHPHSLWQVLEHMRIAQADILAFCGDGDYEELNWPADYWPPKSTPPDPDAWDASLKAFFDDLEQVKAMVLNSEVDLYAEVPHGTGQTYLREALLVADHNAYHLGQIVDLRRATGCWPPQSSSQG